MALLFRSSLSSDGGDTSSYGIVVNGNAVPPQSVSATPLMNILNKRKLRDFNDPVGIGDKVTDCSYLLAGCSSFNQPINIPNNVKCLPGMFEGCNNFNQPINIPPNASKLSDLFTETNFNYPIELPNPTEFDPRKGESPAHVALDRIFSYTPFDQPIVFPNFFSGSAMFQGTPFNQPIDFSNSTITDFTSMFEECENFNQSVEIYSVSTYWGEEGDRYPSMEGMFRYCSNFNSPVIFNNSVERGLKCLTNFNEMFADSSFNRPIDFSNVGSSRSNFSFCGIFRDTPFNQSIIFPYVGKDCYIDFCQGTFPEDFNYPINIDGEGFIRFERDDSFHTMSFNFLPRNFNQTVNISSNLHCGIFDNGFKDFINLDHPINLPTFSPYFVDWLEEKVCSLPNLFYNCTNFNQPLAFNFELTPTSYSNGITVNMQQAMARCTNFNAPITFNMEIPQYHLGYSIKVNADYFFAHCTNFNPVLDTYAQGASFLPDCITNMQGMFYECSNFNVNYISIPRNASSCDFMFAGCNHINHISIFKNEDSVFSLYLRGLLNNTSNALRCEILVSENGIQNNASAKVYQEVLRSNLVNEFQPISWLNTSWGSYNTYYNIYVIQNQADYLNWTP